MEGGHPSFLDGELKFDGGFPDYYTKAWWYKTPHATQALCVLGLLTVVWPRRERRNIRLQLFLFLPILVLFVIGSSSSMQLGIRYLIPTYPFLFLFASQMASVGSRSFGVPQFLALVLVAGVAASVRWACDS